MPRMTAPRVSALVLALLTVCGGLAYVSSRKSGATHQDRPGTVTQTPPLQATPESTPGRIVPSPALPDPSSSVYPFNRVVVISIGINKYPGLRSINPTELTVAESDSESVADALRTLYGYEVVLIKGPDATKRRIEEALDKFGRELGERDALIVFFAGHGKVIELPGRDRAGYLIPADARLDLDEERDSTVWAEQALDMRTLVPLIEGMSAQHVLFIADACNSGYMTKRGAMERWDIRNFMADRSRTVIAAAGPNEVAIEDTVARKGMFTAAFLDALTDQATKQKDAASVLDIFTPVLRAVSARSSGKMRPQLAQYGDGDGMFVFVPLSYSKDLVESDLNASPMELLGRKSGFGGVVTRAIAEGKQLSTYKDVVELIEAPDHRLSDRAEDIRADWAVRCERFKRNAQLGDPWSMAALCLCYEKGLGVEENGARAYEWARRVDDYKKPAGVGRFLLGRCYEFELGVSLSGDAAMEQSRKLYRESAEQGFGPGLWATATKILNDHPSEEQAREAMSLLRRAADDDVIGARVDLARLVLRGEAGIVGDRNEALTLLESAAKEDVPRAHHVLYGVYTQGEPGYPPIDRRKAERHLRRAVELGSRGAVIDLGNEYFGNAERLGLERDDRKAYRLYDRAAQHGNGQALTLCAQMLAAGRGTDVDHALARERIEQAVKVGIPYALYVRGEWYAAGTVYPRDEANALLCFTQAADTGLAPSCRAAARMYFKGLGFTPRNGLSNGEFHDDWHRGLHYLMKAHELGDEDDRKAATAAVEHLLRSYEESGSKSRARLVVVAWARDYPSTFRYFYEHWSVDPKTFGLTPKGAPAK